MRTYKRALFCIALAVLCAGCIGAHHAVKQQATPPVPLGLTRNDKEYRKFTTDSNSNVAVRVEVGLALGTSAPPLHINDREYQKFGTDSNTNVVVRVVAPDLSNTLNSIYVEEAGDDMTGNLGMGGYGVTNVTTIVYPSSGTLTMRADGVMPTAAGGVITIGGKTDPGYSGFVLLQPCTNGAVAIHNSADAAKMLYYDSGDYFWFNADLDMGGNSITNVATNSFKFANGTAISVAPSSGVLQNTVTNSTHLGGTIAADWATDAEVTSATSALHTTISAEIDSDVAALSNAVYTTTDALTTTQADLVVHLGNISNDVDTAEAAISALTTTQGTLTAQGTALVTTQANVVAWQAAISGDVDTAEASLSALETHVANISNELDTVAAASNAVLAELYRYVLTNTVPNVFNRATNGWDSAAVPFDWQAADQSALLSELAFFISGSAPTTLVFNIESRTNFLVAGTPCWSTNLQAGVTPQTVTSFAASNFPAGAHWVATFPANAETGLVHRLNFRRKIYATAP